MTNNHFIHHVNCKFESVNRQEGDSCYQNATRPRHSLQIQCHAVTQSTTHSQCLVFGPAPSVPYIETEQRRGVRIISNCNVILESKRKQELDDCILMGRNIIGHAYVCNPYLSCRYLECVSVCMPYQAMEMASYSYFIKLRGLSPRANYTDRAAAAGRRSQCQLLRIEGCHVVSATDPHGR